MICANIYAFRYIKGAFPSKPKVILFSRSDDGSKWLLLCSLLHPTTKHLNRLGVILVYICSGGETTDDSSLRAGSEVRHQCSLLCWNASVNQTIVGGASVHVTSHGQTARFEKWVKILVDKKNTGWIFYHYRVVVYTHCQHTFMFKLTFKSACSIISPL